MPSVYNGTWCNNEEECNSTICTKMDVTTGNQAERNKPGTDKCHMVAHMCGAKMQKRKKRTGKKIKTHKKKNYLCISLLLLT